jgi:general secretion pathway protein A
MRLSSGLTTRPPDAADEAPAQPAPGNYLDFYGLGKPPFGPAAEPAPFLPLSGQRAAFEALAAGLRAGRGHLALTGEAGSGKTTLVTALLAREAATSRRVIRVGGDRPGILTRPRLIAALLDIPVPDAVSQEQLAQARTLVTPRANEAKPPVLAIDDAHLLAADALDWLTRVAGRKGAMPQLLLVGRPEMIPLLQQKHYRPLSSRMAPPQHLGPLTPHEMRLYIERRLWLAGSSTRRLLTSAAVRSVLRRAGGSAGRIDALLEAALARGFLLGHASLTASTIRQAAAHLPQADRQRPQGQVLIWLSIGILLVGMIAFAWRAFLGLSGG